MPDNVGNLQGYQLDYCCVFISWDPPYTLPGLTAQYLISIGTEQHELNSTNYTYCPLNLTNKEYQFNITTSNKVVTVISCSIHNTSDCYSLNNNITINNDTLITSFTLPSHMFFTTDVTLKYVSGQTFTSQNKVIISKYNHSCAVCF